MFVCLQAQAQTKASGGAAQAACQSHDQRSKLPPVRDQDSMGWCYGFVAADLLSFRAGQNISAMDMSMSQYKSEYMETLIKELRLRDFRTQSEIEGPVNMQYRGYVNLVLMRAAAEPVCLEKDFPSLDFNTSNGLADLQTRLYQVESYSTGGTNHDEFGAAVQTIAPNVSSPEALALARSVEAAKLVEALRERTCVNKVNVNLKRADIKKEFVRGSKALENIQRQLNKGNIVGMAFNEDILYDANLENFPVNHAASVIGQRWNSDKNECELLVRNSFGPSCAYVDPAYTCEEDGHIWMPASTLVQTIESITYVEK